MSWLLDVIASSALAAAVLAVGAYLAREYLRTFIAATVQHDFDKKLANVEAEFKARQATLDASLRAREAQIESLRGGALSSMIAVQTSIASRRIEAADDFWASMTEWNKLLFASAMFETVNFEESSKLVPTDTNTRNFFGSLAKSMPEDWPSLGPAAASAQPYVSDLAWALHTAYVSILSSAAIKLKMLSDGLDGRKFIRRDHEQKLLVAALPDWKDFIEKWGDAGHHSLLETLRKRMLDELRKTIDGTAQDADSVRRAAEIVKLADTYNQELAKGAAASSPS